MGTLPSTKWRFLRHLSLADNALTNISVASLAPLANTLQSLDLSSNLFTEIPDSLATLSCLRALNLSGCMIESLHSLGRNPLPAITTLNLRSNRLSSLIGIERLLSLERVDVRDNKLTDPTEVARLTGVPEITEIYVQRNPFCKSYSSYRVTILNLFRKTPGYTEDILIDGNPPTTSEKKQLVDRAPELPNVPVVKPIPDDDIAPPAPPKVVVAIDGTMETPKRNPSHRTKSSHTSSQRRKKTPRRRVVEISQQEADSLKNDPSLAALANPFEYISSSVEAPKSSNPAEDVSAENIPHLKEPRPETPSGDPSKKSVMPEQETVVVTAEAGDATAPPPRNTVSSAQPVPQEVNISEYDASSDLYKKKIEALRQDFGNTWLSALGDEGWETTSVTSFPERGYTSPTIRPNLPRTPSQGIVSGGRTLG